MGILERLEEAFVDVSSTRATRRELLEHVVGAVIFVVVATGLTGYLLGRAEALVVAAVFTVVFGITIVSQAYWAVAGRDDYEE